MWSCWYHPNALGRQESETFLFRSSLPPDTAWAWDVFRSLSKPLRQWQDGPSLVATSVANGPSPPTLTETLATEQHSTKNISIWQAHLPPRCASGWKTEGCYYDEQVCGRGMERKMKQSAVERSRTRDGAAVRSRLMWVAYSAIWAHDDSRIPGCCEGPCFVPRLCGWPWPGLQPKAMLMSKTYVALKGHIDMSACATTWFKLMSIVQFASEGLVWIHGFAASACDVTRQHEEAHDLCSHWL